MIKIINGAVALWPYSLSALYADHPNTVFAPNMSAATLLEFGAVEELATPAPAHNPLAQAVTEVAPALVDGVWTQQWLVVDLDAETVAVNQANYLADLQSSIVTQTQVRLDAFAQTRGYDGILSACTYATSAVPRFAAEGQCAVNARDDTWSTLYTVMGEVQAGTRPLPTGFADVEPLLPALEWPT